MKKRVMLLSEMTSFMAEHEVASADFFDRLLHTDAGTAEKLLRCIGDMVKVFRMRKDPASRAAFRRAREMQSLYMNAVEEAGYRYEAGRIVGAEEENDNKTSKISDNELESYKQMLEEADTGLTFKKAEEYTREELSTIKEYLGAVDERLLEKAEKLRMNKNERFERINIGDVTPELAEAIKQVTGVNCTGFKVSINNNAFNHIEKRHGVNGIHDRSMANLKDVARIGFIVDEFDECKLLVDNEKQILSTEFSNNNGEPSQIVLLTKKIDGTYTIAIAAVDSKYNKIWVVTTYTTKKEGLTQAPHDEYSSFGFTSETVLASHPSTVIIPRNETVVNTENEKSIRESKKPTQTESHAFEEAVRRSGIDFDDQVMAETRAEAESRQAAQEDAEERETSSVKRYYAEVREPSVVGRVNRLGQNRVYSTEDFHPDAPGRRRRLHGSKKADNVLILWRLCTLRRTVPSPPPV